MPERQGHISGLCCVAVWRLLLVGILLVPAGCYRVDVRPPAEARRVIERINSNLARIEAAVYGRPALVSFRFRDDEGRVHRFLAQPATLIFRPPRCLYFDIKNSLSGSVARLGSNEERYWLWVDVPEMRRMWWGTWDALLSGRAQRMVVPPDLLLDALMMRPLTVAGEDELPPMLVEAAGRRRLWFQHLDERGWPFVAREIVLGRWPRDLPVEIIDRLSDGRVAMRARLYDYRPVGGSSGALTPRRYVVVWPIMDAELRLDLLDARYRTKDTPFCEFPRRFRGEVVPLDVPAAPPEHARGRAATGRQAWN